MTSHRQLRTTTSFALLIAAFAPSRFCLAFVGVQQTSRPLAVSARRRVPAHAISSSSPLSTRTTTASVLLAAKKGAPKGFGKAPVASTAGQKTKGPTSNTSNDARDTAEPSSSAAEDSVGGLQSVEGASTTDVTSPPPIDLDPSLSMEERTKQILRQQYGLKPAAETEQDVAKARREMELAGTLKKRKDKLAKYKEMSDEEFDVFEVLPAPLLKFIDAFLKGGLAITTTLFIGAGIGITIEAWSKATGSDLPEGWDDFIVSVVEPNFTKGLFVLLGFSISLGVFASAQLGSGSSVYSEDP